MIDLRTLLVAYLKTLYPRVYFQVAPENAIFPYVTYYIPSINCDGEGFEVATIDIDGWDMNDTLDTTIIENLMKTINGYTDSNGNYVQGLDKKTLSNENISTSFFIDNKLAIVDEDKRIKRREYTYQCRIIRRE